MEVIIVRNPQSYTKSSPIDINKISQIRWDSVSGGVHAIQGWYSLYGYIDYSLAMELVDCSGDHDYGYNGAKICIPEGLNKNPPYKDGYDYLSGLAGKKPKSKIASNRPEGFPPCTKYILEQLRKQNKMPRLPLRKKVVDEAGYQPITWCSAIKRLQWQGKIIVVGEHYTNQMIIKNDD